MAEDMVNYPPHYTQGKIEVIDFLLDQKLDFCEGSVVKYICRWRMKNGVEDLKKARWYLSKLIEVVEEEARYENSGGGEGNGSNDRGGVSAPV